jgi:septum formation protein
MSDSSFVLASSSPRRKEILARVGFSFEVRDSGITEEFERTQTSVGSPKILALAKAQAAAAANPGPLVVGADTLVMVGDHVLGKPTGIEDARRMLELLSGRTHAVVTGVALAQSDRTVADEERTDVRFRSLSDSEVKWYLDSAEPWDKAGAYAIQGRGSVLVERIEGSFLNVVGFPVSLFVRLLERFTGRSWLDFLRPTRR